MRNYIIPVDTSYVARYKDYLYELEATADTLTQLNEFGNTNYFILNKTITDTRNSTSTSSDNYTLTELLKAGVISFLETTLNATVYTILHVAKLKHHRGLINKYGKNTRLDCRTSSRDSSTAMTTETVTDEMKAVLTSYGLSFKDFLADDSSTSTICFMYSSGTVLPVGFYKIPEGYIVISNVLEEGKLQNITNSERKKLSNYILVPAIGSASYYLPNSSLVKKDGTSSYMTWNYISEGTTTLGTEVYFNLNTCPMRVYYHGESMKSGLPGCSPLYDDMDNYSFLGREDDTSSFAITSYKGTLWTGFNNNLIVAQYATRTNNIEQEIFVDDTIEYGSRIVDNSNKDYYTINVKNFKTGNTDVSTSPYYVKLW